MSENRISVVELSTREADAEWTATEVTGWLLGTGIIAPSDRPDRSEFRAGPNVRTVCPDHDSWRDRVNNGVDVVFARSLFHPVGNYVPPDCPHCRARLEHDAHHDLIEPWLTGPEPSITCPACGQETPAGDWTGRWTFQVAEVGVCFNNWSEPAGDFLTELGARLGPRWRVVRERY